MLDHNGTIPMIDYMSLDINISNIDAVNVIIVTQHRYCYREY